MLKKGERFYALLDAGSGSGARITVDLKGGPWVTSEDGTDVLTNSLSVREFETKELNFLPVSVLELAPKVKDSSDRDIEGSERPNVGKPLTPLVEVNPYTSKIAYRELKVSFDPSLNGKRVTWTLEMVPGAMPSMIRGQWNGRPRFEESTAYGRGYGFRGVTTKIVDGHTAVRVNVPPIGLNQVRIKLRVAGLPVNRTINLIDMEVPAVVVIDPGHGGTDSGAVGRTDRTVKEADLALAYGLQLKDDVTKKFADEKRGLRLVMTRTIDDFMGLRKRAQKARDNGADVFLSIHFNFARATSTRGTEYVTRSTRQVNAAEDARLGASVQGATLAAVQASDSGGKHRDPKMGEFAVLSDYFYGNTAEYHPIRGTIIEVEFLTHATALESVKLSTDSGKAIKAKFAKDVADVIYRNARTQP